MNRQNTSRPSDFTLGFVSALLSSAVASWAVRDYLARFVLLVVAVAVVVFWRTGRREHVGGMELMAGGTAGGVLGALAALALETGLFNPLYSDMTSSMVVMTTGMAGMMGAVIGTWNRPSKRGGR